MARAASLLRASLAVSILGVGLDTAFTQTVERPPLPVTRHGKLALKKEHRERAARKREHRESAKDKQKRAECQEQAQKLLDDADKRAYMKGCLSNL